MIIKSAEFITSAVRPNQYPKDDLPEIAFAGRSNVGKSSLINTLINRKRLVKTSATPGRTQLINFFLINGALRLVDLPGYGYAKVPQAVRRQWGPMVETYIKRRSALIGVVVIMDVRRDPGPKDLQLVGWLNHYRIPYQVVLTKADKLSSRHKQLTRQQACARALQSTPAQLVLFSARTRKGREALWSILDQWLPEQA